MIRKKIFNFCLDGSEPKSSDSEAEKEEIEDELLHKAGGQSYHVIMLSSYHVKVIMNCFTKLGVKIVINSFTKLRVKVIMQQMTS